MFIPMIIIWSGFHGTNNASLAVTTCHIAVAPGEFRPNTSSYLPPIKDLGSIKHNNQGQEEKDSEGKWVIACIDSR